MRRANDTQHRTRTGWVDAGIPSRIPPGGLNLPCLTTFTRRRVWIWCGTSSQVPGRRCGDRTEAAARDTKSELAEANDAAQELHGQLQRPSPRAEADRLRQEALDELAGARAAVQTLTGDLTTATGERDDLQAGVDDQAGELTSVREQPAAETRRADETTVRADRERAPALRGSVGQPGDQT